MGVFVELSHYQSEEKLMINIAQISSVQHANGTGSIVVLATPTGCTDSFAPYKIHVKESYREVRQLLKPHSLRTTSAIAS